MNNAEDAQGAEDLEELRHNVFFPANSTHRRFSTQIPKKPPRPLR